MPNPIWNHAATCVIRLLQHNLILTDEQENSIWSYVNGLPVRTVVDLLAVLDEIDHTLESVIFTEIRVDDSILAARIANADHYLAILNNLRILLGQSRWFLDCNPLCENANKYFQYMRDVEVVVGFDSVTFRTFYEILSGYVDDLPVPNNDAADDDASTVYSENIEPLENSLDELMETESYVLA